VRIATWNVNSIKQRLDSAVTWLAERKPDIVCLQETKCVDDAFPREPFEALGYNVAVHGQKAFNGVALLSKFPFDEVSNGLPGNAEDDHARFLEAVVSTGDGNSAGLHKITGDITQMAAQVPALFEALSGMQMSELIKKVRMIGDKAERPADSKNGEGK